MVSFRYGPQLCTTLAEAAAREWLVADGCGGYAMGTIAGLRTRRYHGLQIVALGPVGRRCLGLAALDPVIEIGTARVRLATHEWTSGAVDPTGYELLTQFHLTDGVPCWRWAIGDVILEREVAMDHGRAAVGVVHRLVASPAPVRLRLDVLCTWRDVHGERVGNGPARQENLADGFCFEDAYRVRGPGWSPSGIWYRAVHYREEHERGLNADEDLWCAGSFSAVLEAGAVAGVEAWAAPIEVAPQRASELVSAARERARVVATGCGPDDEVDKQLAIAADQMIVEGPAVVAGYPWFGEWSRDALSSYEGLFLCTKRFDEGRHLLEHKLGELSQGMLANTSDPGTPEFNSADGALWLVHALARHVGVTGDEALAAGALAQLETLVAAYVEGTRHHLRMDPSDGLLSQGESGLALTWMDAVVDGEAVTPRRGKAVEINALWVSALHEIAEMQRRVGRGEHVARLASRASVSFLERFVHGDSMPDVIDGDLRDGARLRPNQLFALSLPSGPARTSPHARAILARLRRELLTPLGLRSLAPSDPDYRPRHRGSPVERDRAYHNGTVWPWLIGAFVDAALALGASTESLLEPLEAHLGDAGVGSVSETADGAAPHHPTGCPFQAWSVAELFRARRAVHRGW